MKRQNNSQIVTLDQKGDFDRSETLTRENNPTGPTPALFWVRVYYGGSRVPTTSRAFNTETAARQYFGEAL